MLVYTREKRCWWSKVSKSKVLPESQGPCGGADLPFPQPSDRHQLTLRDHGYGASLSRSVPVYSPDFAGTHCANPWRDGQAKLAWVAGYIPRWLTHPQMVTHPCTKQARCRVTSLITTNALTTTSHPWWSKTINYIQVGVNSSSRSRPRSNVLILQCIGQSLICT